MKTMNIVAVCLVFILVMALYSMSHKPKPKDTQLSDTTNQVMFRLNKSTDDLISSTDDVTREVNRTIELLRPPFKPWAILKDANGRYNFAFESGRVSDRTTYSSAQKAYEAMLYMRGLSGESEPKQDPNRWTPVDVQEIAPEELYSTGTIGQMPVSQPGVPLDQLVQTIGYLLAERQQQDALFAEMVERIDQDTDMVIEAIPELEGIAIDDAVWSQEPEPEPEMTGAARGGETNPGPSEVEAGTKMIEEEQ